ncbi:MAG: hypothetical protein DHS20C02_07840 [Micavibrio sp.]|nr:MAG: hypothetical protein DHS20C02_07840 [Micavibrio sp.]
MDDAQLKKILDNADVPATDDNARKRAVNMAMAEFKESQKESEKKYQGIPFLSRLMGKTNTQQRRDPMEKASKKKLYMGTALVTASLAVLALPITFEQMYMTVDGGAGSSTTIAELNKVKFNVDNGGSRNIAKNITDSIQPKERIEAEQQLAEVDATYAEPRIAGNERQDAPVAVASVEESISTGASSQQAPVSPPARGRITADKKESKMLAAKRPMEMAQGAVAGFADSSVASSMIVAPHDIMPPPGYKDVGRDKFEDFKINPIKTVAQEPVSTFSVDVDTASYSFVRRQLNSGVLPQKDAVRIEELVNYFDYNYPMPESKAEPFKATVTLTPSPWAEGKKLMHIGIKGYDLQSEQPKSNIVFLLDVSGSMNSPDKLPLVKNSMKMLLDSLNPDDTIAIAVYAGAAGTVLEPTKASEKGKIMAALDQLSAGGSTAGAAGINLAYQLAEQNFDEEAVNRVILATDGDFNVGITNREELKDFVERKREKGIFLSVLGFGQGNYNDHMMQTLAQNGNGVAAYIDSLNEARKVLVDEATSTLFPIAKDVKLQVEFNPEAVAEYRLVGYETRHLNREDFNNDKVDAGDIGAGHTVTAIYEITPVGSESVSVDPLRYSATEKVETHKAKTDDFSGEYAFLKIRYKLPKESKSKLITTPVTRDNDMEHVQFVRQPTHLNEFNFATAVAGFAQILKGGQHTGDLTYDDIISLANGSKGEDTFGYRAEFVQMVRLAKSASTIQPR